MSSSIMKVSEAKTKMCPFIQISVQQEDKTVYTGNINCKCNECMAWVITKTEEIEVKKWITRYGEYSKSEYVEVISLGEGRYKNISTRKIKDLEEQDCEGYCKRI